MAIEAFHCPESIYAGAGMIDQIGDVCRQREFRKVFVVTDRGVVKAGLLGRLEEALNAAGIRWSCWSDVEGEPGIDGIDRASGEVMHCSPDALIGLGGGSVIDTAKLANAAAAHGLELSELLARGIQREGKPLLAVPTTSGTGSEVTPIAIVTVPNQVLKVGVVHRWLIPRISVVDPTLTGTLPARLTALTGIDALSHAVESLLSPRASVMSELYSIESIRRISRSLRLAVRDGRNAAAREDMSYASLFAGLAFANAGVGAIHAIGYPVGGRYHLSHGECISLFFVETLEQMMPEANERLCLVAAAFGREIAGKSKSEGAKMAVSSVRKLISDVGASKGLGDYGIGASDIADMAEMASCIERLISNSPKKLTAHDIVRVYEESF